MKVHKLFLTAAMLLSLNVFAKNTLVIGDIEGRLQDLYGAVTKSTVLKIITEGSNQKLEFNNEQDKVVFIGNMIDHGGYDVKVLETVVDLKERYPERVELIMGNRDINKLRLLFEMKRLDRSSIENFRIPSWHSDFEKYIAQDGVEYKHGKDEEELVKDKMFLFKFLLTKTMGASKAFENFKRENQMEDDLSVWEEYSSVLLEKGLDLERDTECGDYAPTEGLLYRYLTNAKLVYFDADSHTLYTHGALNSDNFLYYPQSKTHADNDDTNVVKTWSETLNKWAQECIQAAYDDKEDKALELIRLAEPKLDAQKNWDNENSHNESIIIAKPWTDGKLMPTLAGQQQIYEKGVHIHVSGHTPVGDIPVYRSALVNLVNVDTSYSKNPEGQKLAAVHIDDSGKIEITAYYSSEVSQIKQITYGNQNIKSGLTGEDGKLNLFGYAYVEIKNIFIAYVEVKDILIPLPLIEYKISVEFKAQAQAQDQLVLPEYSEEKLTPKVPEMIKNHPAVSIGAGLISTYLLLSSILGT
jgi:hypothetical protein